MGQKTASDKNTNKSNICIWNYIRDLNQGKTDDRLSHNLAFNKWMIEEHLYVNRKMFSLKYHRTPILTIPKLFFKFD